MRRGAANPGKRRVQASRCDWIVVGAGIAGASLAYWLAPHGRVVVLEQEAQPGYHATGRSAALYLPGYGPAQVRALTLASREFLSNPPAGFATAPILSPRGALTFGTPAQRDLLERHFDSVRALGIAATRLDARGVCERVPVLHERLVAGGIFESDAFDIDVGALLQGFLRGVRAHGGVIECGAAVRAIGREGADWWAGDGRRCWRAPVLVDAAGAWADAVAALAGVAPLHLQPKRRSAFLFRPPEGLEVRRFPSIIAVDESFYVKPDAAMLLGSPANADPVPPHDVLAEALDVATGIARIERFTTLRIRRPTHVWAGLRTFTTDGCLVGGFDPLAPGFFWCAGQGGYGIQSSPAMGEASAALVQGRPLPARLVGHGLDERTLGPARLRT